MISGYTKNLSIQMLISLMEQYGIKNVVASAGTTNLEMNAGLQYNGGFNMYSSVDERSGAYMACGIAYETGKPVAITCTEATASRDYYPGITEAYYRKLPILTITGVHRYSEIGHLKPQIIDRSESPKDTFVCKVHLPVIKDKEDIWETMILINKAMHYLTKQGGGPVHIDLPCCNDSYDFSDTKLIDTKKISFYNQYDPLPDLPEGRIAIFIGSHSEFPKEQTNIIDQFCAENDAVVFCDITSGYHGKYQVRAALASAQKNNYGVFSPIDVLIHLGGPAADEGTMSRLKACVKRVWRVNEDGEIRDTFRCIDAVFEMNDVSFFRFYLGKKQNSSEQLQMCISSLKHINTKFNEMPFSNLYIASKIAPDLPSGSMIHLGVSNTVRAWTIQNYPNDVLTRCNVGCRGIDGVLSTAVGASLVHPEMITFCVLGDLTFFYDMNVLGNRNIKSNLRVLMINNNGGSIFKRSFAPGYKFFGDEDTDKFIAGANHWGAGSKTVLKHFAEDLGFTYITASSQEEFDKMYKKFLCSSSDKPIVFEVFTRNEDERAAFDMLSTFDQANSVKAKEMASHLLGEKGTRFVKKIIGRK